MNYFHWMQEIKYVFITKTFAFVNVMNIHIYLILIYNIILYFYFIIFLLPSSFCLFNIEHSPTSAPSSAICRLSWPRFPGRFVEVVGPSCIWSSWLPSECSWTAHYYLNATTFAWISLVSLFRMHRSNCVSWCFCHSHVGIFVV